VHAVLAEWADVFFFDEEWTASERDLVNDDRKAVHVARLRAGHVRVAESFLLAQKLRRRPQQRYNTHI